MLNQFGQPIGPDMPDWQAAKYPDGSPIVGRLCCIERLDTKLHTSDLFKAFAAPGPQGDSTNDSLWTYMPQGPFASEAELREWMQPACEGRDPLFHAIIEKSSGQAVGIASYLRISPEQGVIEVGYLIFAPRLQRSTIATEAMFLMMQRAFELGYRRYEWKCDALNAPSRRAATRLGFSFDGLFKQAVIYKGRNRDTAWYSVLDRDWPEIQQGFTAWLNESNFTADEQQKRKLSAFMPEPGAQA